MTMTQFVTRFFLPALLASATYATAIAQDVTLTILHTNDTHSRIMPLEDTDPEYPDMGGVARREAYFEQVRAEEPNVLVFDSGDFSQGTPFYSVFKGEAEVELMNELHYDAATIGNHEFDYGLDNLSELVDEADFPIVCTNYDFTRTPLKGKVERYLILRRGGLRIGVIGLGARPEGLVQAKNYEGMQFVEPYEIAEKTAHYLKHRRRCDIVVCLSHLGMDCSAVSPYCDRQLVARTSSIDVVLGGHSHTYMRQPEYIYNAAGRAVPVMQNGKNGVYVGRFDLKFEKK